MVLLTRCLSFCCYRQSHKARNHWLHLLRWHHWQYGFVCQTHQHYYQIQGQLYVTGWRRCYLSESLQVLNLNKANCFIARQVEIICIMQNWQRWEQRNSLSPHSTLQHSPSVPRWRSRITFTFFLPPLTGTSCCCCWPTAVYVLSYQWPTYP